MDTLLISKRIYTVTNGLLDGAIGITGDKISYVGPVNKAQTTTDTRIIDLGDMFIMPGLIEGHTHMMPYRNQIDFSAAASIEDCQRMIVDFHKCFPEECPVVGYKWFEADWGGSIPSRKTADAVLPDTPFWASDMEMHRVWMNSAMMKRLHLSKETILSFSKGRPDMVDVDENGDPTGIVHDEVAMDLILSLSVKPDEENIGKMFDIWTRLGVTSINDMDFFTEDSPVLMITKKLLDKSLLNVRVFSSLDAKLATDNSIETGKSFMNCDMFRLNALKSFLDGTAAGFTAFMLKPYKNTDIIGASYRTEDELYRFIRLASSHGLATHFHACGDAAVRQALNAYKRAASDGIILDERSSIEHLDTALLSDVEDAAKLGISLNMTPDFLAPTKKWKNNPYIGIYTDDVENTELFSLGSFINTGINVSFGTDGTASSFNPMDQLYRAVTRRADDGFPDGGFRPAEAVDIQKAIYCYTIGSAKSIGMSDSLGSIEIGKYADISVFDTDLLTASYDEIKKAKAVMVISDGRIVYQA
ncbi:MAG: amidohydrolase family protein [Lachnospiraceae bacterium]|nr:amidohydrolase family protein [Lachnospiraceae bacterium]